MRRARSTRTGRSLADLPPLLESSPAAIRAARRAWPGGRAGAGIGGPPVFLDQAENRTIPGPVNDITLRVFTQPQVDGVYLHLHGGGVMLVMLDAADLQDERLWAVAQASNAAVVSVDYRLAPEHRYPAAWDDGEAAALWIVEHAPSEFGTDRIAIGGESGGALLAVPTLLRMRDKHGYTPFAGANLVYGAYDFRFPPSHKLAIDTLVWDVAHSRSMSALVFPPSVDLESSDISTIFADLADMPPALFTVGTFDPLVHDSLFMAKHRATAGNHAELAIYPGAVHRFDFLGSPSAEAANSQQHDFIRRCFANEV